MELQADREGSDPVPAAYAHVDRTASRTERLGARLGAERPDPPGRHRPRARRTRPASSRPARRPHPRLARRAERGARVAELRPSRPRRRRRILRHRLAKRAPRREALVEDLPRALAGRPWGDGSRSAPVRRRRAGASAISADEWRGLGLSVHAIGPADVRPPADGEHGPVLPRTCARARSVVEASWPTWPVRQDEVARIACSRSAAADRASSTATGEVSASGLARCPARRPTGGHGEPQRRIS